MGIVYQARDFKLDRFVALKFLPPSLYIDQKAKSLFITEARAASSLDHPNICTIYEIDETEEGQLFFAMAYYHGQTLREKLLARSDKCSGSPPCFSPDEAVDLIIQIAHGLGKAHAHGIIHRDIKPANIIVTGEGVAKILDFGLAAVTGDDRQNKSGSLAGTIAYMSPEQIRNRPVDQRSDLWSLGVVFYEMLTGRLPFSGDFEAAMMYSIVHEDYLPLPPCSSRTGKILKTVLDKILAKEPQHRYQTAEEFIADVISCKEDSTAAPAENRMVRKKTKRLLWPVASMMLVAAIICFYYFLNRNGPLPVNSEKVLAVMPFSIQGAPEFAYLQNGMIDLISMNICAVSGLRSVDPRALLYRIKATKTEELDLPTARKIARSFGAGRFVMGSFFAVQGQVRFISLLYYTDERQGLAIPLSAEGTSADLFPVIDGLTSQIVGEQSNTPAERMRLLGSRTTRSWPAFKAYLQGLQCDRDGLFQQARTYYVQATRIDSTFALAWLRLSLVDFGFLIQLKEAKIEFNKAIQYGKELTGREELYLQILTAAFRGDGRNIIATSKKLVEKYPDDVFGWDALSNWTFHYVNQFGRSATESKEAFKQLLLLDPENATNYQSYAMLANLEGDRAELDALHKKLTQLSPNHEWAWPVKIPRDFVWGDAGKRNEIYLQAAVQNETLLLAGIMNCALVMNNLNDVVPLVRQLMLPSRSQSAHAFALLILAVLETSQGRWKNARTKLDSLGQIFPDFAKSFTCLLNPTHYLLIGDSSLLKDYQEHLHWRPSLMIAGSVWQGDLAPSKDLLSHMRLYGLGLMATAAGDTAQSAFYEKQLLQMPCSEDAQSMTRIWATILRSRSLMKRQQDQAALECLEKEPVLIRFPLQHGPAYSTAMSRYIRAEVLSRLGRSEEALKWHQSLAEVYFYDLPYRAPSLFKSAQLYEKMNMHKEAVLCYGRFMQLWQKCDPEYAFLNLEAQQRLNRLKMN